MKTNESVVLNNLNDNATLRIQSIINDNGDIMSLVYEAYNYIQPGYNDELKDIIEILNRQYETIQQVKEYNEAMKEKLKEYEEKE
jgi:hypothetical protein